MTAGAAWLAESGREQAGAIVNENDMRSLESSTNAPASVMVASSARPACDARDFDLIAALRRRDEAAFTRLVSEHHRALLRVARAYVPSEAVAEEVVQETWLGVLRGLDNFEGRCSLKTWIFQILINRARTRGERESRTVAFSALEETLGDNDHGRSIDPSRFDGTGEVEPQGWLSAPRPWDMTPEQVLLSGESREHIERAIVALPANQQEVITLRDVQGWTGEEVCHALGISEANCRVLLHRARGKVRQALEDYFATSGKYRA